jgi:hypothetical protein
LIESIDDKEKKSINEKKFEEFLLNQQFFVDKAIAHTILEKQTIPNKKNYMLRFCPPFLSYMQGISQDMKLSRSELYEKIISDIGFRIHVVARYLVLQRIGQKKMSSLPRYFRRRLERRNSASVPLDLTEEEISNEEESFLHRITHAKTDEEWDQLFNIAYLVADGCARIK